MMKPYSLLLVSWDKPDTPEGIHNSNQMLGWGLWQELSRLSHVSLSYCHSDHEVEAGAKYDFALLHCYFDTAGFARRRRLRNAIRRKILGFSEATTPGADLHFTFLDSGRADAIHVACPCLAGMLRDYTRPKRPSTILLDHPWWPYQVSDHQWDWSCRLWEWLWYDEPEHQHEVSQLTRGGHEQIALPHWIAPIPEMNYGAYLDATAETETFIVTHRGSYEHSVIDMAARGTRVLVPAPNGDPFIPAELVDHLGLEVFASREQLRTLLAKREPRTAERTHRRCLDMPAVVSMIDGTVQGILRAQELLRTEATL